MVHGVVVETPSGIYVAEVKDKSPPQSTLSGRNVAQVKIKAYSVSKFPLAPPLPHDTDVISACLAATTAMLPVPTAAMPHSREPSNVVELLNMPRDEVLTEPERFDLAWFRAHRPLTLDYKIHNAALKFFRHQGEEAGLIVVPFDNMRGNLMKPVIHGETTDFGFDFEAADIQWRWQDMVAMLTSESMRYVVEGELRGDSSAVAAACLTGCSLCQSGIIDHKRAHADKKKKTRTNKALCLGFRHQSRRRDTGHSPPQLEFGEDRS